MAKISQELRDKLNAQRKTLGSGGGIYISNKDFGKRRLRILPCGDDLPGRTVIRLYHEGIKKSSVSPATFMDEDGNPYPCPIKDYIDGVRQTGTKADKAALDKVMQMTTEVYMGVYERGDMGTPDAPKIRIWQGKPTIYSQIIQWMLDEDDGEAITDPDTGRDVRVWKTGAKLATEWHINKLDKTGLECEDDEAKHDKAARAAFVAFAAKFDVNRYVAAPCLADMEAIYEELTGDVIPSHYRAAIKALEKAEKDAEAGAEGADDDDDDAVPAATAPKAGKGKVDKPATPATTPDPDAEDDDDDAGAGGDADDDEVPAGDDDTPVDDDADDEGAGDGDDDDDDDDADAELAAAKAALEAAQARKKAKANAAAAAAETPGKASAAVEAALIGKGGKKVRR